MRLTSGYGPGKPEIDHATGLSLEERCHLHGQGSYRLAGPIVAGSSVSIAFELEVGAQPVPAGGKLGIVWRWPFDWGDPRPADARITVAGSDARMEAAYDPYGGIEPYHHQLLLHVRAGTLAPGSKVRVDIDRWQAPTCAIRAARFLMLVDPTGKERWTELPGSAPFEVMAGPPAALTVIAPADAVAGETMNVIVRADDAWGNPTRTSGLPEMADCFGVRVSAPTVIDWPAACHYAVQCARPGLVRLRFATPEGLLAAESNPIRIHAEAPSQRLFWGDLHSGQSAIGCGAGTLADYHAFARDAAGLQFLTHQANDHYVTTDDWAETRRVTDDCHAPGRFVPILGCEWSPPTKDGGDRNVFYLHDDPKLVRSGRFFTETTPDPEPDVPRAPEFLAAFRERNVLVNMHVGGRQTNLDWHEPAIEKLAEIHSTHGTVEWFVFDALRRGYRVGITAGSDGVMGRPGACLPGRRLCRNQQNGLTGLYARDLTRAAIWEALQARRCFATSGTRIRLWCEVDGQPMGAEYETAAPPRIFAAVEGTAALERIDLLRGVEVIHTWPIALPDGSALRVLWSGTTMCGNARKQRADWDGTLVICGGTIGSVQPVGFQHCDSIEQESPQQLRWSSKTAGNAAGLILQLEGEPSTCRFRSASASFDFTPAVARAREVCIPAGGFDRQVRVGPAPRADGPRQAEVSFIDQSPTTGDCPYWVRVVQVDQARAWSSPVYCRRVEPVV